MSDDTGRTWSEHLAWCKERALEYVDRGDLQDAVASMGSDLGKHPETAFRPGSPVLGALMVIAIIDVVNHDTQAVRRWIEGF